MTRHVTDAQISAFLAGENAGEKMEQLCQCPQCRQEVAQFTELLQSFKTSVHAWSETSVPQERTIQPRRLALVFSAAVLSMVAITGVTLSSHKANTPAPVVATAESDDALLDQVTVAIGRLAPRHLQSLGVSE
jgi:hypothetical protein